MNESKFCGALLGLAVGDALGQPVEAFPPERIVREFGEVRDFMAGDPRLPLPLLAGQWTDDTQMALAITRSLLKLGRVDPADISAEFLADQEGEGIRFSGFTVKYSLLRMKQGHSWKTSGIGDEQAQGNGSCMRIAPVGLLFHNRLDLLKEAVWNASIMTHTHPETLRGAEAVAYLVARGAAGTLEPDRAVLDTIAFIGDCKVAENLALADSLLKSDTTTPAALKQIGTSGWVVHTVAAAAYCFLKTPSNFERSVIDAVMGGDDADTTGAVTGAISGAYDGEESIPSRWLQGVERGAEIREMARGLSSLVRS